MIHFDPTAHAYTLNGKRLPNVTSILSPLSEYAEIPRHILDAASERGNYVHKMCELYLWGTLDESGIEPEYAGYLEAFKRFLSETGFEAAHIEERVYHRELMYAGTIDLGGTLPPRGRMRKAKFALIDIKTTFRLLQSVGPQTAAYLEAWNSHKPAQPFEERFGLQLKKEGTYVLQPYPSSTDFNIFRSCLAVHNFMRKQAA